MHFILNVVFVLIILYLTLLLIRLVYRKTSNSSPHILKEISLGQTSKVQYVKIGDKLYLLAQNGTQIIHIDTISDPKMILELINDVKSDIESVQPLSWQTIIGWFRRSKSVELKPEQFDSTLKKIIQNSSKLEDLNNR
jgi:flagellar biogenesis protein FliO